VVRRGDGPAGTKKQPEFCISNFSSSYDQADQTLAPGNDRLSGKPAPSGCIAAGPPAPLGPPGSRQQRPNDDGIRMAGAGGRRDARRWPSLGPAASLKSRLPNTSIIRHQARPAPAPGNDRPPDKPAHPDDIASSLHGPAHGQRPGKPAAGQRRAESAGRAGGAAMALLGPAASLDPGCRIPASTGIRPARPPAHGPDRLPGKPARPDDILTSADLAADIRHERELQIQT
jgi:hypothetical protein